MSNDKMRENFEAWAEEDLGLPMRRLASGDYQSFGISMAWKAWQASRAAVVVELPQSQNPRNSEVIKAVGRHILSQGLKVKP